MKNTVYKKTALEILCAGMASAAFTFIIILIILIGLQQAETSGRAEGLRILEESILRAIVQSYAVEGRYPDSLSYIETRYGVHVDRARYIIHYNIIAPNLMPDVAVIELKGSRRR